MFKGVVSLVQKELSSNLLFHLCILEYLVNYVTLLEEHNVGDDWIWICKWGKIYQFLDIFLIQEMAPLRQTSATSTKWNPVINGLLRLINKTSPYQKFKNFHMHITIDAKWLLQIFSLFYSFIFFFQMICLQVSRILLKYSVNLFNCLSVIWQSKECTHIRLNLIIFILKYFIFFIANLLKVQCF